LAQPLAGGRQGRVFDDLPVPAGPVFPISWQFEFPLARTCLHANFTSLVPLTRHIAQELTVASFPDVPFAWEPLEGARMTVHERDGRLAGGVETLFSHSGVRI